MYENYWNLREKPFRNLTDRRFFFFAETYEEAYLRLLYSIRESQGLFLLLGEGGCGKTFLIKVLLQDLSEQGYRVAFIPNPANNPSEFLQQVLDEFGLNIYATSKLQLIKELKKLTEHAQETKGYILIVDDAHLLQDPNIFQEIRVLLNFEDNNRFLISPILVGKPELSALLDKTPLKEHIGLQYHIQTLNCKDTAEYIYYRMDKAGSTRELFTSSAIKEIHNATRGVVREINNVCDLALLLGYGDGAIVVDQDLINKTLKDFKGNTAKGKA